MAKKGLSLFLCLCMLFSVLSTIAYTNNSIILTGAALDDFLADSNSNNESSKNNTTDSTIGSTDFTVSSEISLPDDCYYYLDMEAPETAKPGETINVVFTIKNIKEELIAVEFFLDFDHTKVAPVITKSEKPMDAFMTKTPMYTVKIFGTQELPAMEQICYYNSEETQYELRFLDLRDYPGIVGEEPTMLVNDGDLIVTVPFLVLDTVSEGDEFTFSLIEGTVWGVTAVGLNDVPGTGDSATVVVAGGTGNITPSGTCGENLTWTLDNEGTLTISGTGDMWDYNTAGDSPWDLYKYIINSVIIQNGVTTIGDYAFMNCHFIESITIPESVTTIEDYAFYTCTSLESITGVKGSAAEAYAIENGFTFIALDITKLPENDFYMDEEALTMPNIAEGTKASDIISTLAEYGITATVTDKNGNAIADNAVVSTGCVVKASKDKEYVIIIWGDTDGNGRIDTTDYLKVKSTMYGINSLTGAYFNAADADDDGCITVTDYLKLKAYLLN